MYGRMVFEVSNDIMVYNPSADLYKWCRENLVIDNPDYITKLKRGLWLGNTPKTIDLYERVGENLLIPFGCLKALYARFHRESVFKPVFKPLEAVEYNSGISLYDYQERAVNEALKAKNGIIVMPCGSGKTQTALELVSRIGGSCLWLTHTQDLLNQSMNRAKACFDLPDSCFGTITGGKVNIAQITFATVQTMCKLDLLKYRNQFDIIVVDECHKCVGSPTRVMQFYKVLTNLSARYKFGITATPDRNDGLERSMFSLLGDIFCVVFKEDVKNTTCPVVIEMADTGYAPDMDAVLNGDGTINYTSLVDDLIHNEKRFETVLGAVLEKVSKGSPAIILANRVEYLEKLTDSLVKHGKKAICLSTVRNTRKGREERKNALKMLDSGELDFVLATYQLAKEGLDVPSLRYLILATPEKDETTVTQSVGRVGRKADGKDFGTVLDFKDSFGMYNGWAKKRIRLYKKLGYEVKNG